MGQAQRGGGEKQGRGRWITVPRQNVDDDRGGMDALVKSFSTGGFDGDQAITGHAAEDLNHLAVTVIAALQLAADPGQGGWQHPIPERGTIAQSAGFASQNTDIVPRVIDRLTSPVDAGMVSDDYTILPDDDPIRIGIHINRPPDGRRDGGVSVPQGIDPPDQFLIFVTVEPHRTGLRHRRGHAVESVERPSIWHKLRPFRLEHIPDRLVGQVRMTVRFGVGHAFVQEPGVQFVQAFDPQTRGEEPFPDQPNLVLDLALLPA